MPELAPTPAVPQHPDPSQGVFETLLVVNGRAVELDAHLARLGASLEALFPDRAAPQLTVLDPPGGTRAWRIAVAPVAAGLRIETKTWRAPGAFLSHSGTKAPSTALATLAHPGLGAHKWADRLLLEEAQARLPADALPLIVDSDGTVLEASRANIFAVRKGALFTPPLDGRILPGITRARVLDIAATAGLEAHETELHRNDLLAADEVFLTGSVRGIERVDAVDGVDLAAGGEITAELASALRRAWPGTETGSRLAVG